MIFVAVLLLLGVSAVIYTTASSTSVSIANKQAKYNEAVLVQAKDALIGYAAKVGDPIVDKPGPGHLPCPDTDNDGSADSPCGAKGATAVGRLPWRTLGLPDLRDSSGECLWYAVSGNFKNSGTAAPDWVNSDSSGTLAVYDSAGTLIFPATSVAAIVFAAATTLAGQDRSPSGTTICGGNTNPANYLDSYIVGATTFNNATGGGTNSFITAPFSDPDPPISLNDRLLPITTDALFSVVEWRVLRELRTALRTYRTNNGYFPGANPYSDGSYSCDYLAYQGRLPLNITLVCTALSNWGSELPSWFGANNWQNVTYYAVSPCQIGVGAKIGAGTAKELQALCDTTGDLSVDGSSVHAVMFTAGSRIAALGQSRPCTSVSACLEGAENTNDDKFFVSPVRSPTNNDRISVVWP